MKHEMCYSLDIVDNEFSFVLHGLDKRKHKLLSSSSIDMLFLAATPITRARQSSWP